jgi:hypothetical protein
MISIDYENLTDDELHKIYSGAYFEMSKRMSNIILSGLYLKLNDSEKDMIREEKFILAVKSYSERTLCNLLFSKAVCEYWRQEDNCFNCFNY